MHNAAFHFTPVLGTTSFHLYSNADVQCGENAHVSVEKMSWNAVFEGWEVEKENWSYGKGALNDAMVHHYTEVHFRNALYSSAAITT